MMTMRRMMMKMKRTTMTMRTKKSFKAQNDQNINLKKARHLQDSILLSCKNNQVEKVLLGLKRLQLSLDNSYYRMWSLDLVVEDEPQLLPRQIMNNKTKMKGFKCKIYCKKDSPKAAMIKNCRVITTLNTYYLVAHMD